MGGNTHLLPIVKYFVEDKLKDASWAMAIIITDGIIDDMEDVKNYTEKYTVAVHANKQKFVKLVLIGLGESIDVGQLEELDDFVTSVGVDVWRAELASNMEELECHDYYVDHENIKVSPNGKVLDNRGQVLKTYSDAVPAKIYFTLKPGSTKFKLEIPGIPNIEQDLAEALNFLKQKVR